MNRMLRWTLLACLVAVTPLAWGQDEFYGDERRERRDGRVPEAGFWPTPLMLERFLDRITEDMAERYELDEYQLDMTRESIKNRLPSWMNENRGAIMTVMNEFIEAQLNDEAPTPEDVAEWAGRALPLLQDFKGVIMDTTDDMREFLNEDQQITLEGEIAAFNTGIQFMSNKLHVWQDGGFDPEVEWVRDRERRREIDEREQKELHAEMEYARQDARARAADELGYEPPAGGRPAHTSDVRPAPGPGPRTEPKGKAERKQGPKVAKDEWTRYVDQFIKKYQLTDEQQASAQRFLTQATDERTRYLRRKGDSMERIEKLYKQSKDKKSLEAAEAAYAKLNEPVENMFTRLKEKLEKLPTRAQRKAAIEAAKTTEQAEGRPGAAKKNKGKRRAVGRVGGGPGAKKRESPSSP